MADQILARRLMIRPVLSATMSRTSESRDVHETMKSANANTRRLSTAGSSFQVPDVRLVLAAIEPPLADAFERFCGDLDFVTVHRGSIVELHVDAVVSPANSYGFMDG